MGHAGIIAGAALAIAILAGPALAEEPVADFYRGKTVSLLIGSQPGGGFKAVAAA